MPCTGALKNTSATVIFTKFAKPALLTLLKIIRKSVPGILLVEISEKYESGKKVRGFRGQEYFFVFLHSLIVLRPAPQLTERLEKEGDKNPYEF